MGDGPYLSYTSDAHSALRNVLYQGNIPYLQRWLANTLPTKHVELTGFLTLPDPLLSLPETLPPPVVHCIMSYCHPQVPYYIASTARLCVAGWEINRPSFVDWMETLQYRSTIFFESHQISVLPPTPEYSRQALVLSTEDLFAQLGHDFPDPAWFQDLYARGFPPGHSLPTSNRRSHTRSAESLQNRKRKRRQDRHTSRQRHAKALYDSLLADRLIDPRAPHIFNVSPPVGILPTERARNTSIPQYMLDFFEYYRHMAGGETRVEVLHGSVRPNVTGVTDSYGVFARCDFTPQHYCLPLPFVGRTSSVPPPYHQPLPPSRQIRSRRGPQARPHQ